MFQHKFDSEQNSTLHGQLAKAFGNNTLEFLNFSIYLYKKY